MGRQVGLGCIDYCADGELRMVVFRRSKLSRASIISVTLLLCALSGCHSHQAAVKSSTTSHPQYSATKDGHYRVRKGDTLHAIAFKYGVDWRDIASLNHIPAPYLIYPDQQLRLPAESKATASANSKATAPVEKSRVSPSASTPVSSSEGSTTTTGLKTPRASTTADAASSAQPAPREPAPTGTGTTQSSAWQWPTNGRIISNFKADDPARNGIDISGEEGQDITASAAGEVVYSGNGLISYGELIIIKHNDRMLSAYAHNRTRLVSEGQKVESGAKIAEMGRNGRNQALLHFEIRVDGAPKDPLKYLPSR